MEEEDDSDEHLKEYSPSFAFTMRRTTPVVRAVRHVCESDSVAPATGDLCDGCKATERHASDSAEHDGSLQESFAVLSMTSVVNSEIRKLAGASHAPAGAASSLASISGSEPPSALYKSNGKPTIDRTFFKSMAKTIKASRASIADAEVVDEEACTHYTGNYTSNSCGEETRYVNWIEGDALRMRIELKFRLIHERMLVAQCA